MDELYVEIEGTLQHARLVGIDGLTNVGLLHVKGAGRVAGFAWRRGKSRNCKPGDVVMAVGAGRNVQVGTMCCSRGADPLGAAAGECCAVGGMTTLERGTALVDMAGHVVGMCVSGTSSVFVSEYAMRKAVKALADAASKGCGAELTASTRGRYYRHARYMLCCLAVPYEGEYVALGLASDAARQMRSRVAGYRVLASHNASLAQGDVVVAVRFAGAEGEKRYVLGSQRGQACVCTVLEKLDSGEVVLEGYSQSGEAWERRVTCEKRCDALPWYEWNMLGVNV